MPQNDIRATVVAKGAKHLTSGRRTVIYRDGSGRTRLAMVLGAGSTSGLKLAIGSDSGRIVDNVAKATTSKSTNAYIAR
jgi:hypothetical protein